MDNYNVMILNKEAFTPVSRKLYHIIDGNIMYL